MPPISGTGPSHRDLGHSTTRPRGPHLVRAALIAAARAEWSAHGLDVPLRAVAARADVNHGLIHHYIGNKEDLLREVLAEDNDLGVGVADSAGSPAAATRAMFLVGTAHPEHSRLSARVALDGRADLLTTPGPSMSDVVVAMVSPEASSTQRTRAVLALTIAAVHGWSVFGDQIMALVGAPQPAGQTGREAVSPDALRREMADLLASLLPQ